MQLTKIATGDGRKRKLIRAELKTKASTRIIPVPKNAMNVLKELYQMTHNANSNQKLNSKFVFQSRNGGPIEYSSISKSINIINKKLCYPKFSMHTFRHTYATVLIEKNVNIKIIQVILGHKKIETTLNTYSHILNEHKKTVIEDLGELY